MITRFGVWEKAAVAEQQKESNRKAAQNRFTAKNPHSKM
jgi:hypothetical protein